jgi:DNA-binding GntR family transcriptional regulator
VAEWSKEDIIEVYGVRALLESYAAGLASQSMGPEDFEELHGIIDSMREAAQEGDASKVFDIDMHFHLRSYELSGNELLCRLLGRLRRKIHLYVRLDVDTTPDLMHYVENHALLMEALEARDAEYTEKVFREHILSVGKMMAERFSDPAE